jgi:Kef-type K+ transport system membrane component KefB
MGYSFLTDVVALLLAGAVIAYICFRLGLVPIVGFLVAGVVIGPNALGLVHDRALVDAAAEVGVMFLLCAATTSPRRRSSVTRRPCGEAATPLCARRSGPRRGWSSASWGRTASHAAR